MPGKKRQSEGVLDETEREEKFRFSRQWDQLHQPLLEMILHRLPLPDYFRFPSVCQSWQKVKCDSHSMISLASHLPWLMIFKVPYIKCSPLFYDVSERKAYDIPLPLEPFAAARHRFVASSCGWILLHRQRWEEESYDRLFLHPISGRMIELPWYEGEWNEELVALSSPPTDPTCVVAVPWRKGFALCRLGDEVPQWRMCGPRPTTAIADYYDQVLDIAFSGGRFYGLTRQWNIVVLESSTNEFEKLDMDGGQLPQWRISFRNSLVVSQGQVLLVSACDLNLERGDCLPDVQIQVFQADLSKMAWVRVWSLGEKEVFMSDSGSCLLSSSNPSSGGRRGNRIWLAHPHIWCSRDRNRSPHNWWCLLEYDLKDGAKHYHPRPAGTEQVATLPSVWVAPSLT